MKMKMKKSLVVMVVVLGLCIPSGGAAVIVMRRDYTFSLDSREAAFSKHVGRYGVSVHLVSSIPLDGCALNVPERLQSSTMSSPFVLISGGGQCSIARKVQNAQEAGFSGAIIFGETAPSLHVPTTGDGPTEEVGIYVIFVSKSAGAILQQYAEETTVEIWILPGLNNSFWASIAALMSFIILSAIPMAFMLIRKSRLPLNNSGGNRAPESFTNGSIKRRIKGVRTLPIVIFTGLSDGSLADGTCAICQEDYLHGERLRVLPCLHKFHSSCIDAWLATQKPVCPLCRRDPRPYYLSSSETTPLLAPPQPILQQSPPAFAYGTTDIESSSHSPPMQIPNVINSQFQSMPATLNPQTPVNNRLPVFATSSRVSEHTTTPFRSQADSSLQQFRTSPLFISPRSFSAYLSPLDMR